MNKQLASNQADPQSGIISFYKKIGETPLEALSRLRKEQPELAKETLSYAGRLDPLAEGILLVLIGDENKNREKYLGLDKEYELDILLGFSTDTGDVLGLVKDSAENKNNNSEIHQNFETRISEQAVIEVLKSFVGKQQQAYPAYSSKTVNGVSLHTLARQNKLPEKMPTQEVEIYSIDFIKSYEISSLDLLKSIRDKINAVNPKSDFRQQEILEKWQEVFSLPEMTAHHIHHNVLKMFQIIKIKVNCSSGTYMRVLAEEVGKKLGKSALAFHIKRTKLGK